MVDRSVGHRDLRSPPYRAGHRLSLNGIDLRAAMQQFGGSTVRSYPIPDCPWFGSLGNLEPLLVRSVAGCVRRRLKSLITEILGGTREWPMWRTNSRVRPVHLDFRPPPSGTRSCTATRDARGRRRGASFEGCGPVLMVRVAHGDHILTQTAPVRITPGRGLPLRYLVSELPGASGPVVRRR